MRKLLLLLATLWTFGIEPSLAQYSISQLPPATVPLTGNELVPCTQSGTTKKCLTSSVAAGTNAAFLLQAPNASLPLSRTLVGTANQVILTDGGALGNLTLSLPQSIATTSSPTFSSLILTNPLTVPNGGTGATSITGLVLGNGISAMSAYAGTSCTNQFPRSLSSSGVATCATVANTDLANSSITLNGTSVALGGTRTLTLASADFANQGTTTTVLHGNAAGNPSFTSVTSADLAAGVFANPTGTVTLTATNGVATTAMRSDASPPLSQSISPTWTGTHTFNNTVTEAASNVTGSTAPTNGTYLPAASTYGCSAGGVNVCRISNTATQFFGPTAAALVDSTPDTGTFTANYTGFTAAVTCTATWARVGKVVVLTFCAATGTSNATTFTMTGLPAAITPAALQQFITLDQVRVNNNSTNITTGADCVITGGSSTVTFATTGGGSGWTAAGTKGFTQNISITYQLN